MSIARVRLRVEVRVTVRISGVRVGDRVGDRVGGIVSLGLWLHPQLLPNVVFGSFSPNTKNIDVVLQGQHIVSKHTIANIAIFAKWIREERENKRY